VILRSDELRAGNSHAAALPRRLLRGARGLALGVHRAGRDGSLGEADWYALPADQVMARLGTGPNGLDASEAARRLRTYGANAQANGERHSRLAILGRQFANLPTALLLGSSVASSLMREIVDALAIQAVVLLNAAIGYRIESKNEELLESWRRLEAGEARVIRGSVQVVSA
jgi:P-type Ca2+ transporter type 2C